MIELPEMTKTGGVTSAQQALAEVTRREQGHQTPDLAVYDIILVNSSAGKDSMAMLAFVCGLAAAQGVLNRVGVIHADLGRVEWAGTKELAARQAEFFGVPFGVVERPQGDLLTHVEKHGRWPDPARRYCTSDHKTKQVRRVLTHLVKTWREKTGQTLPCRILNCLGMRADESPARAKLVAFTDRHAADSNGKRAVARWLPLHGWKMADVWEFIEASGMNHLIHPAYELGMPRLSCCFCIMAPKSALVLAGHANPALLAEYVAVEAKIGHRFTLKLSMAEVAAEVATGERPKAIEDWRM